MYRKDKSLSLKTSASALSNNFSVHVNAGKSTVYYAVVHKFFVNLISSSLDGQTVNHRQIIGKEPTATFGTVILQARLVAMPSRVILVITCQTGLQMFDVETGAMLYWYALEESGKDDSFSRGICALQEDTICVGTSEGEILLFDIPARGSNFTVTERLKGHYFAITDLQSDRSRLVSADDSGCIIVWSTGAKNMEPSVVIQGYNNYPCTSVAIWNDLVIGGYGSGHLRLFSASKGQMIAEVTAHAKWINAIDVAKGSGRLLSAGEDSFVRIWQLSQTNPQIEHLHNECVANQQLQGAKFISPNGKAFGCTGYDSTDITFYMAV